MCGLLALECCNLLCRDFIREVRIVLCESKLLFHTTANKHWQRVTSHKDSRLRTNLGDQMIADRLRNISYPTWQDMAGRYRSVIFKVYVKKQKYI